MQVAVRRASAPRERGRLPSVRRGPECVRIAAVFPLFSSRSTGSCGVHCSLAPRTQFPRLATAPSSSFSVVLITHLRTRVSLSFSVHFPEATCSAHADPDQQVLRQRQSSSPALRPSEKPLRDIIGLLSSPLPHRLPRHPYDLSVYQFADTHIDPLASSSS